MARLTLRVIVLLAFAFLAALAFLTLNQPSTVAVDATPACAPQPNPCAAMSCKPRPERNLA